jgi:3-oxoacyl-[acyl-carrier protein] reductase|tara:strand:+ start:1443 stop:2177 length:735 start_codon:yes stop_codon:yes gene_type:complete
MIDFKNKKILITGATGGIGNALVKKFLSLGGTVLATGTNNEKLNILKNEFPKINVLKFDISNHLKIENFIEDASSLLSGLDVLVNNAGITMDNLSLRMKNEEWQKVIDINLSSTFYLCKYAIKKMLRNKYGRVVNISSIVGHTGNVGQSNYSASKAGMVAMSKSLAIEYAKKNITINCVSPGFIQTKMTDKIDESMKAILTSRIPMSKLGTGEDVSNTVAFLSSDASSYITGETIHVNGGMYMG